MAYHPHRRHAVSSLSTATQALGFAQHLYTPNTLILLARILAQIQITSAAYIHPNRTLLSLCVMVALMNVAAALLHCLDFAGGMNGGKGLMLDFVGQAQRASLSRVLLMDLMLWALQTIGLTLSYVNNLAHSLPEVPQLPYDDLLLPSEADFDYQMDEEDFDLENGLAAEDDDLAEEKKESQVWLDDESGPSQPRKIARNRLLQPSTSIPRRARIRDPPLVYSLPLSHILTLILRLPGPAAPPPAFAGGTPATTRPPSPRLDPREPLFDATADADVARSSAGGEDEADREDSHHDDGGISFSPSRSARRPLGIRGEVGRIPGDYWVGSTRGNGG